MLKHFKIVLFWCNYTKNKATKPHEVQQDQVQGAAGGSGQSLLSTPPEGEWIEGSPAKKGLGTMMGEKLNHPAMGSCSPESQPILGCITRAWSVGQDRPPPSAPVRPLLECCIQVSTKEH